MARLSDQLGFKPPVSAIVRKLAHDLNGWRPDDHGAGELQPHSARYLHIYLDVTNTLLLCQYDERVLL
jgi:hypothetical protein